MKSSVTPYAALGVGMAIVLTVGLSAISGVLEQPFSAVELKDGNERAVQTIAPEERAVGGAPSPSPAPPSESDVATPQFAEKREESPLMKTAETKQSLVTEEPAAPLAVISMAGPWIAAAIVGSAVFVVIRKRGNF